MRSKTSFFSSTIFKKDLSRFWPLWAVYFIVWFCVLPLPMISNFSSDYIYMGWSDQSYVFSMMTSRVLETAWAGGLIISGVFGVFAAMAVFGHLYNSKSAGMMASLPIRREGLFATSWLAGVLPMLAINVIVFLIALLVEAAYGVLQPLYILQGLGIVCLISVAFFGFASLCAMLTGNMLVLPFIYAVLNFAVYVTEQLTRVAMESFIFGMDTAGNIFGFLSPPAYIFIRMTRGGVIAEWNADASKVLSYSFDGWGTLALYCLAGLLLSGLALWLYMSRRMEAASDVVAFSPLKPVFKYCMAFGCALVPGAWIYWIVFSDSLRGGTDALMMTAFMLAGGFIGYFAAEMLMKKALLVFKRSWKGFAVFTAAIIVLAACCELDVTGYEKQVPKPQDVESVVIFCHGDAYLTEPQNIEAAVALHQSIISGKTLHEGKPVQYQQYVQGQYQAYYNQDYYVTLHYALADGSTLSRSYKLLYGVSDDVQNLEDLLNTKEAILYRNTPYIEITQYNITHAFVEYYDTAQGTYVSKQITAPEMYQLYTECIMPDLADCTLGRATLYEDEAFRDTQCHASISFNYMEMNEDGSKIKGEGGLYINPTIYSARTNEWLKAHGIELITYSELDALSTADGKY